MTSIIGGEREGCAVQTVVIIESITCSDRQVHGDCSYMWRGGRAQAQGLRLLSSGPCPIGIPSSQTYRAPAIDARSMNPGRHAQDLEITPFLGASLCKPVAMIIPLA